MGKSVGSGVEDRFLRGAFVGASAETVTLTNFKVFRRVLSAFTAF